MTAAGKEASQLIQLRTLLAAILPQNAFYARKFASIDTSFLSLDEFSTRVPFTRKHEMVRDQEEFPPYGSNLTYPLERYNRFSQTSGTTGRPLHWLDTPESWDWMLGNWTTVFRNAGVTAHDRILFAFSFGPFLGFWTAFEAATRMGCLSIPGGGQRSSGRLNLIVDNEVTVLCCTPTYAIHLAEAAETEGIDMSASKVRLIVAAGEPGASIPSTRAFMEQLWNGARVFDHHGMTEVGPVSYECPSRPGVLHVMESSFYAEVIDAATGAPVTPGTTGELVLTNLGRIGSPLIRYRTGDLVCRRAAGRCECGTDDMALEGGILGRSDDMVVVRGVNVFPSAIEDILRTAGGVAEHQVEIHTERGLSVLSMRIEPAPDHQNDAGLAHRIENALYKALALRIPVTVTACGALPRFELKARRWNKVT